MSINSSNIDVTLVSKLIEEQFPQYQDLPIRSVSHQGWDNRTFRLGDDKLIRLPSAEEYIKQVAKEHKYLPLLADKLSLTIPSPIALGLPSKDFPWAWSIYQWLEGESANMLEFDDAELESIAIQLGFFLSELHKYDGDISAAPELHNWWRAAHTSTYDKETRELIEKLKAFIDEDSATSLWNRALDSKWEDKPIWVHGDVASGNILIKDKNLSAVIDFGCMGIGDPACDLTIAWTFFKRKSRIAFKNSFSFDNNTWTRARGWALWKALYQLNETGDMRNQKAIEQKGIISEILDDE